MTLILRVVSAPTPLDLGPAGLCRVGLADVVGAWGSGRVVRVMYLGAVGAAA